MSFYTALTGLNGSQADIAATSNNIANVGTTGFKRSRAEFGDIFATSPLQNSSSSIGSGSILKGVKQQFTQGNIAASLNALDLAISGQGFFALKPSLTSSQVVYTRNGSFNVDNNRNVVDSTGQFLLTYPVNEDGSVTSKTINDAVPLQLPVTSGEPKATSNIDLAINLPADAPVITDNPKFADGYQFSSSDPESFTNSTSLTIFDDLGNPTIATVYFIKTQAATADDPTNKYDTRLVIDETVINPDLVASVNDNNEQIYIDRFGNETTVANIPDDNYFSEGKGSALYRKDDLNESIPSQPAKLTGSQTSFDFGEEGNKLIQITNDPMMFNATREAGNADSSIFWGKDFLLVNVDDGDVPVSIDLRPGFYNATQLAAEVQRAINDAYGDDNKLQVRSNVDDTLTVDFYTLNTGDGTLSGLPTPVSVDLLSSSYVTEQVGIDTNGSSPDFTREEFLAHAQLRINETMNDYGMENKSAMGLENRLFSRVRSESIEEVPNFTDIIEISHTKMPSSQGQYSISKKAFQNEAFVVEDLDLEVSISGLTSPAVNIHLDQSLDLSAGAVSITSDGIFLGDGTNALKIGELPFEGAQTTSFPLKLSLSETFRNGSFENTAGGDTDIDGWSISNDQFISGTTSVDGIMSTADSSYPNTNNTLDLSSSAGFTFFTAVKDDAGNNALKMDSSGNSDSYAVVRGPYISSEKPVQILAGDTVSFRWKAQTGADSFDVLGYMQNVDTGEKIELLNQTGTYTDWATVEQEITEPGNYQFVFVSGSFDETGGRALGATLYIDDISLERASDIEINQDIVQKVLERFSISDLSSSSSSPSATLNISSNTDGSTLSSFTSDLKDTTNKFLLNSFHGNEPKQFIFDNNTSLTQNSEIRYNSSNDTLEVNVQNLENFTVGEEIYLAGNFSGYSDLLNGRNFEIKEIDDQKQTVVLKTSGLGFPDAPFALNHSSALESDNFTKAYLLSDVSSELEAYFETSRDKFFSSRLIVREIGNAAKNNYSNSDVQSTYNVNTIQFEKNLLEPADEQNDTIDAIQRLGLKNHIISTVWVDEKNPPIKVNYDAVNQRFQFGVNHTAIGPGTDSNFRAFKVYGASDADGANNLGIPASDSSPQTDISSTAVISAESFVADGGEMQINAKRFGASVAYNSDTKTFTFLSGTTGETISADGALGVNTDQNASNIQVGRYSISETDGSVVNASFDTATRYMGSGDNGLMGVGASKNDTVFETARGLASDPAQAFGAPATEPLNEIFNLSSAGNANVFNVSVNGISGIIEVPSGNYVGSTLAAELQTRINQISDTETGEVVGGVTVKYQADTNNFVFTTGTTGDQSTIKVKGAAKLGLDDVPLGVGSVPTIVNLVQATNDAGVPLYVNAAGEIVETPPDNLVTDYYPLYIDEGELTFDKTGQIISPLNRVHYEQQAAGFSISLDVDYSASTQLSQPFSVNNLEQDGFTSGRLDGLDIDATGLLRANYTNGENRPLGKIVLANFNNQNGLKQVGNATFVETATSGTPTFGEAGAEGFGAIQSGSLERSNVDITEELVNLITAQRNFQASSKAIETSTQLTQAIINIRS